MSDKRPRGRPRGSMGRTNAKNDIARAIASGMSLEDIVVFLSEKIADDSITDKQREKFLDQLISIKLSIIKSEARPAAKSSKSNDKEDNKPKATTYQFKSTG